MEQQINSYPINQELTFYDVDKKPFRVQAIALILTQEDEKIVACSLILTVDQAGCQLIRQQSLFNLKPEANFSLNSSEFLADIPYQLEIELRPDLLPKLLEQAKQPEEIIDDLMSLGLPEDLSLAYNSSENWYCLSVKQLQETGEVGYRTLWDYMNLSQINQVLSSGHQVIQSLSSFIEDTTQPLQSTLEEINSNLNLKTEDSSQYLIEVLQKLQQFNTSHSSKRQPIAESMRQFFDEDDWNFVEVEDESVLQMAFEGENGRWTCYACAFEASEQFVFYSICPLAVTPEQLPLMTEYLMKINYGLTVGNFELDFTDGEIRYKTSIDVEDERLTPKLVNNLVYTNVLTMDKYLPGITAIINSNLSIDEALDLVESDSSPVP